VYARPGFAIPPGRRPATQLPAARLVPTVDHDERPLPRSGRPRDRRRSAWHDDAAGDGLREGGPATDIAELLAIWLHTVAFVIAWGYYGILGRIVLPAIERSLDGASQAKTLVSIERRAVPLVLISMVLFVVTGTYLLVIDEDYAGLGNVVANSWTTLMLVKHLVIVVLVGLGVAVDVLIRRAGAASDDATRASILHRARLGAEAATALGALVVLLTVAAQLAV
jgi:uncharacterized membrane protein